MADIEHLGLFVLAGILLNLTPGPDVLCIVTQGAKSGMRAGAAAALGIVAGCFVHIAAAALSVSVLIAASGTVFAALKCLAAACLVWIVRTMIKSRFAIDVIAIKASRSSTTSQNGLNKVCVNGVGPIRSIPRWLCSFWLFCRNSFPPKRAARRSRLCCRACCSTSTACGAIWRTPGWVPQSARRWGPQRHPHGASCKASLHWLERAVFIAFGLKLALTDNPVH